jgi:hypothetical protein
MLRTDFTSSSPPTVPRAQSPAELENEMMIFYESMIGNSLLEVELPLSVDKWQTWHLELARERKTQWKNSRILYPHQLFPCAAGALGRLYR